MTIEDTPRFLRKLSALVELFGTRMTDGRLQGYFEALKDLPIGALEDAMATAAKASERFPRPAELRRLVRERSPRRRQSATFHLPPGFVEAEPEHAATGFKLLGAIASSRMPAEQRLKHYRAMATAFPGVGWEEAAADAAEIVAASRRRVGT